MATTKEQLLRGEHFPETNIQEKTVNKSINKQVHSLDIVSTINKKNTDMVSINF